ncbi:uncharacterized protein N7477_001067 [Penicillium maclennaniae]|uniref:uncharacterized protein n=1 Tax=Penicillium maclennaniae TaxID=1343394 RepID=UPI002540A8DD|nr:uncharacterized protein N7477_001067 [Penicillium maclennaniae]KAJ5684722.1 hypothetical protein N7477_001067 [Penicillium maclennaniae]
MRFLTTKLPLIIAASASLVAAQDATTTATATSTKCAAQNDWDCKCQGSTNVVNCYDNCPDDQERLGAQQIREQNCIAAKAYGTLTTTAGMATPSASASASSFAASMSASSSAMAEPTGSRSGLESNNGGNKATQSLTGLEASATPNEGAATARVKVVGSWLAFLGLALGVFV